MFVDSEKAFDNVWRKALWFKLLSYNINGKSMTLLIICITKSSQEMYKITNFPTF